MKKFLAILTAFAVMLTVYAVSPASAEVGDTVSYAADFSEGLPDDWTAYERSDYTNSKAEKSGGNLKITHSNANINAALYYGGLYEIAESIGNVKDFELEMTFRFLSWDDTSRWFGIFYHTQKQGDKLEGYMMNIRVSGKSAQSSVTTVPAFNDAEAVESGIDLGDNKEHSVKITLADGIASHYIDDQLITAYSLETKYALMGGVLTEGGFAIVVNRSAVEISSLTINGVQGNDEAQKIKADETIANTYSPTTRLSVAPSVATFIEDENDLAALKGNELPATAFLYVDDKMNVTDFAGKSLGSFDAIYMEYLRGKIIPAVYVRTETQAEALLDYLASERNLLDIAVASNDAKLVDKVRKSNLKIRGIVDYSDKDLAREDLADIVAEANGAYANIVVLNERTGSRENVTYLQARLKTAWVKISSDTEFGVAASVSSGAYGLVTQNVPLVYEAYKNYSAKGSLARSPFNIAHRGLCLSNYENSLEACVEAYEKGATHVEIDLQLTLDNEIVVMHDDSIARTTNGSGNVSQMTLKELEQYKITKNYNGLVLGEGVKIPTLEDFYKEFKGTDLVLVIEIKTSADNLVEELKKLTEEYGMQSQMVVISFDLNQLERMRDQMPEIPTANLNSISASSFASAMFTMNSYNTVMDTGYGNVDEYFMSRGLRDRGYMSFLWTYGSYNEIASAISTGVIGMTNNAADTIAEFPETLEIDGNYVIVSENGGLEGDIEAVAVSYSGKRTNVATQVFLSENNENGLYVILEYRFASEDGRAKYTLFSEPYKVIYSEYYMSVETIEEKIRALPNDVTLDYAAEVRAIRKAYDFLNEEDKASVSNIAKLEGAEKTIERLEEQVSEPAPSPGNNGCSGCGSVAESGAVFISMMAFFAVAALLIKRRS